MEEISGNAGFIKIVCPYVPMTCGTWSSTLDFSAVMAGFCNQQCRLVISMHINADGKVLRITTKEAITHEKQVRDRNMKRGEGHGEGLSVAFLAVGACRREIENRCWKNCRKATTKNCPATQFVLASVFISVSCPGCISACGLPLGSGACSSLFHLWHWQSMA